MDMVSFPYSVFFLAVTWDSPTLSVPACDTGGMSENAITQSLVKSAVSDLTHMQRVQHGGV